MNSHRLRVCYFGTYRAEYSRNQIMIEGLRRAGVEVIECHAPLWKGIEDRVEAASGGWLRPAFGWRFLRTYMGLIRKYFSIGSYDCLIVGYPGQVDVFLARLLSWLRRKPLVWDIFMSIYLIAVERGLDRRSRFSIGLLRRIEKLACQAPDRLILDTDQYVAWFKATHGIDPGRFRLVPTGADERIYHPLPARRKTGDEFNVLYYGTFIPNHGVETIVEAARLLVGESCIRFQLIGTGPEREKAQALAGQYGLQNIQFVDWLDKTALVERAAQADVCLGAFGTTPQSLMTVQNKIYEGLAMARPVITGDSPAVRQTLKHGENIYLCERANPASLAEAILALQRDPELCRKLSEEGHQEFLENYCLAKLGERYHSHIESVVLKEK